MKYLFTGFEDNNNSSKQMAKQLGKLVRDSKVIILTNNKETCVKQLYRVLERNRFEFIIMFGQKPLIKDKIYLERQAKVDGNVRITNFDLCVFTKYLTEHDYVTKESDNAGTSFCNWIYYHAMKYLQEHGFMTKLLFVHIPVMINISNFEKLVTDFNQILSYLAMKQLEDIGFYIENTGNVDISIFLDEKELNNIMQFFNIKKLRNKKTLKIWSNLDCYKDHLIPYVNQYQDWMVADTYNGNINLVSYYLYQKANPEVNSYDAYKKLIIHEFVHICQQEINPNASGVGWFWEALAIYLSNQSYSLSQIFCTRDELMYHFQELRNGYAISYTIGRYFFDNLSSSKILEYVMKPELLISDTENIIERVNSWFPSHECQ